MSPVLVITLLLVSLVLLIASLVFQYRALHHLVEAHKAQREINEVVFKRLQTHWRRMDTLEEKL